MESGTYRLEFDIVGDPLKGPFAISFRVGTIFEDKIILSAKEMVKSVSRKIDIQAQLRVRLIFQHQGGNFSDVMLDNVRLMKLTRGK